MLQRCELSTERYTPTVGEYPPANKQQKRQDFRKTNCLGTQPTFNSVMTTSEIGGQNVSTSFEAQLVHQQGACELRQFNPNSTHTRSTHSTHTRSTHTTHTEYTYL